MKEPQQPPTALLSVKDRLFNPREAHKLEDPQRLFWLPPTEVVSLLRIRPGMRIADIGAGTGYFAIPLARAATSSGAVFAVDVQAQMLHLLRQKLSSPDCPRNIHLSEGDAADTKLADSSVDLVFIANVWHELENHGAALREAVRILAPRGRLAILDWRHDASFPPGPPVEHRIAAADVRRDLAAGDWASTLPYNVGRYSYLILARPLALASNAEE